MIARILWVLGLVATTVTVHSVGFYWWHECLPDITLALYFSGVTYTTIGYGDVVLPAAWRLLGPWEGLTGILMCGLSTGFFFALMRRTYERSL